MRFQIKLLNGVHEVAKIEGRMDHPTEGSVAVALGYPDLAGTDAERHVVGERIIATEQFLERLTGYRCHIDVIQ